MKIQSMKEVIIFPCKCINFFPFANVFISVKTLAVKMNTASITGESSVGSLDHISIFLCILEFLYEG